MATPNETHEQRHRRQAKEFAAERFTYLLSLASPTTPQPSKPKELATIVAEETARAATLDLDEVCKADRYFERHAQLQMDDEEQPDD